MCILNKPDTAETKLWRPNLSYYVHTYQAERNIKLILFKIMILHDEYLENLFILLGNNNSLATSSHASVLDLPTNDDLSKFLDCVTDDTQ